MSKFSYRDAAGVEWRIVLDAVSIERAKLIGVDLFRLDVVEVGQMIGELAEGKPPFRIVELLGAVITSDRPAIHSISVESLQRAIFALAKALDAKFPKRRFYKIIAKAFPLEASDAIASLETRA